MTRDDKPTVPRFSAVLPAEAARPVEFSRDELDLAVHMLEAVCDGKTPYVLPVQQRVLRRFCSKLEALGVPPLDPSELHDEPEQEGDA